MIRTILLSVGYVESARIGTLIFTTEYFDGKTFETKKEALHSFAKDIWFHWLWCIQGESEEKSDKCQCGKKLTKKYCPDCGQKLGDDTIIDQVAEFSEWLEYLPGSDVNEYGQSYSGTYKFTWSPYGKLDLEPGTWMHVESPAERVICQVLHLEGIFPDAEDEWVVAEYEKIINTNDDD